VEGQAFTVNMNSHFFQNISSSLLYYLLYTLKDCNLRKMAVTKYGGVIHGVYVQYK